MTFGNILVHCDRRSADGELFSSLPSLRTWEAALELLLEYELGYGGCVLEAEPTRVVTRTEALGVQDTTLFEGRAADMDLPYRIALTHSAFLGDSDVEQVSLAELARPGSHTWALKNLLPLMKGTSKGRAALLAVMGWEWAFQLARLPLKDLLAAALLVARGDATDEQARELLGVNT